ncbi:extensin [Iris pallida]|uniref:Extensin n=1 Tax=Iris pallida TaxID=29817 RepID=A0AAX6HFR6_IRIPA|nr:extensin [Iris pallida]
MGKWGLTGGKGRRCSAIGGGLGSCSAEGFTVSRRKRDGSRGWRSCAGARRTASTINMRRRPRWAEQPRYFGAVVSGQYQPRSSSGAVQR